MNRGPEAATAVDYSIVIPAFDEQDWLHDTLVSAFTSVAARSGPVDEPESLSGEVIVVDNNSTDNTAAIAAAAGARVVFEPVNQISRARNTGARTATGRYLVFLDADTRLTPELLDAALTNMHNNEAVGGGVVITGDRIASREAQRAINSWNWLSSTFGMAAGCFVYCRRDAFEAVGGFSERLYASEEIWLSRALKKYGAKHGMKFNIIEQPPVETSLRKLDWYTRRQLIFQTILVFFPFALFSKTLCAFWYKKPSSIKGKLS